MIVTLCGNVGLVRVVDDHCWYWCWLLLLFGARVNIWGGL
jgi:hypothetical protein